MQQPKLKNLTFARADLKSETFDTVIMQKGYKVIWEEGMFCSCMDSQSGQPNYTCPYCGGKGYIYFNPRETKALVTSISGRKDQERVGLNEQGGSYLTPLSTDMVGFRDRFTFVDFTVKFSEVCTKGAKLKYPAQGILTIRNKDKSYVQGIDFNLSDDKLNIDWINSSVQEGDRYSLLYLINPVYIAINPIHELRGTYSMAQGGGQEYFVPLPSQYHIKREDFLDANTSIY